MTNARPPLFTTRLRSLVDTVRCTPAQRGWLVQVLDDEGEIILQHPNHANDVPAVTKHLAAEGIITTGWHREGASWMAQAHAD